MCALKIIPQNRVFTKTGVRCHQNRGNLTLESHRRNRCNTNVSPESNFPKIEGPKIGGRLYSAGVGNDFFFQGGVQGVDLVLELRGGIRGVDFWTQKLTNFDQNSNFSLF